MAYTQDDIDALERAIATGARDVTRGDERVSYRSLADMQKTLATMKREVAASTVQPRQRILRPATSRGF